MSGIHTSTATGLFLFSVTAFIDKLIVPIPYNVYIPVLLVSIGLILAGMFASKRDH